jgi:hypothetical protein
MIILFNTDKNIAGNKEFTETFIQQIDIELKRFSKDITKVIAYVSDENAAKIGLNDKKCVLEARLEGRQPIAVTHHSNTVQEAVTGAIEKLKVNFERLAGY